MSIEIVTFATTDQKEFKLHTVYSVISEQIKPSQLVGQWSGCILSAELEFESKFEQLLVIWLLLVIISKGHSRRQSNVFTAKSMVQLLGQPSFHSLGRLDRLTRRQAQTLGVS